ncbi:MAG: AAA family ATPase [Thermoguttaceae bacterium]
MSLRESGLAGQPAGPGWSSLPAVMSPPAAEGPNLNTYLHALRRRWLGATVAGLVCSIVFGMGMYFLRPARYAATAYLHISPSEPIKVFKTADNQADANAPNAFDLYKATQGQLLKNPFVLTAALRKPEVRGLPSIQREEQRRNALTWLGQELIVLFPEKAQIMEVSMIYEDANEAKVIVNAVVQAYWDEVVNADRQHRRARLTELDKICTDIEGKVRTKLNDLKQLADQLGASEREELSLKQQVAIQQYGEYRLQLTRFEFQYGQAEAQLKTAQALAQGLTETEISDMDINSLVLSDPKYRELSNQLVVIESMVKRDISLTQSGVKSRMTEQRKSELEILQGQVDALMQIYRERLRTARRMEMQREVRRLETELGVLAEQKRQFQAEVDRMRKETEQIGGKSIEIEMMRTEVKQLQTVQAETSSERERLNVELGSAPRIRLLQEADVPENETGRAARIALILMAAFAGLCLPVAGIVLWDTQAGRINVAAEVAKGVGLPVIGSVPLIPARVIRQLGAPTKRSQTWRIRLTESLDGLSARLLRKADLEQTRVVLVSSALAGEGKTTLATQVAMSLARNMRRTVLVDFDLRRPSLHGVFGQALEPGICDVLRGQAELNGLVHPTTKENLWVLTAGSWDRQILAALANGGAAALLDQLRAQYDFVVIDSSPILPVADTRFVSQHVDAVILSIFRDVSQAPKLLAACEILEAFGVRTIEAVVTGGHGYFYDKDADYEPTIVEAEPGDDDVPHGDDDVPHGDA